MDPIYLIQNEQEAKKIHSRKSRRGKDTSFHQRSSKSLHHKRWRPRRQSPNPKSSKYVQRIFGRICSL